MNKLATIVFSSIMTGVIVVTTIYQSVFASRVLYFALGFATMWSVMVCRNYITFVGILSRSVQLPKPELIIDWFVLLGFGFVLIDLTLLIYGAKYIAVVLYVIMVACNITAMKYNNAVAEYAMSVLRDNWHKVDHSVPEE